MTSQQLRPAIYVICLAAYKAGDLHGIWLKADQPVKKLQDAIQKMLAASPVKNSQLWTIHDYKDFAPVSLDDYDENLAVISEVAGFIAEHGALGAALAHYLYREPFAEVRRIMKECYCKAYQSGVDFAKYVTSRRGRVPAHLAEYIDYSRIAKDLLGRHFFALEVGNKIHVFRES